MSASLIILIPVALLAIVGMLCFVGCTLPLEGLPLAPFTTYTGTTILLNPAIIAYWPLGELADTDPAAELISKNNGKYIDPDTAVPPTLYPWPAYILKEPPGADVQSPDAPGTILFAQHGIVKGDAIQPTNIPALITPCVVVNGCYVEAPFNAKSIPQTSFTIEAWVRPDWTANDTLGRRFVLDTRDFNPGTGFGLFATPDDDLSGTYRWAGIIGNGESGGAGFKIVPSDELTIALGSAGTPAEPVHLALTYDSLSQTLTLFADGGQLGQVKPVVYVPNSTQPIWIGAGASYVIRRPQPVDVIAGPLFPFNGAIQDVAIYSAALTPDVILKHFDNGNGTPDI